jgi:transposase
MFFPEQRVRVFLYGQPVDMRRSYDGLYALARHGMRQDPLAGHLFAFINRRATQIKILYFDRSGWCVWAKRLEQGRFLSDWRYVTHREMDWTGLKLLLEGVEVRRMRKRYRYPGNAQETTDSSAIHTGIALWYAALYPPHRRSRKRRA